MFLAPARSYTTTAAAARLAQSNCASEPRFSIGITANRSTPLACLRAHPSGLTARMMRIVIGTRSFRLQNTRIARHQFLELGKFPHLGKRGILLNLLALFEALFQRLPNVLHRKIEPACFGVRFRQIVVELAAFPYTAFLQQNTLRAAMLKYLRVQL